MVCYCFVCSCFSCHHYGGPIEACRTLRPQHEAVEPKDGSRGPFKLEVETIEDRKVMVKVYGKIFKGKKITI